MHHFATSCGNSDAASGFVSTACPSCGATRRVQLARESFQRWNSVGINEFQRHLRQGGKRWYRVAELFDGDWRPTIAIVAAWTMSAMSGPDERSPSNTLFVCVLDGRSDSPDDVVAMIAAAATRVGRRLCELEPSWPASSRLLLGRNRPWRSPGSVKHDTVIGAGGVSQFFQGCGRSLSGAVLAHDG